MNRITQYLDQSAALPIVHRSYDAHGNVVANEPTTLFAFDGRNFDSEVQFNMPRHFDPTVGQWLSEDPVGFAGDDENLRRYVGE